MTGGDRRVGSTADGAEDDAPLLTVVVPTFRSAALIDGALASLAVQTWRGFEVFVSDGASDDGTPALARGYAEQLPALTVDSRPDDGVYDAINRAVARAEGSWVLVLGSDDRLHAPDTLARLAPHLQRATVDVVYGDVRMMGPNQCGVAPGQRYAGEVALPGLLRANICQQAICYRRTLLQALGGFDTRYRLHADWALNLRAALCGPLQWIDLVVADYAATGMTANAGDPVYAADAPLLLRAELLQRPHDRRLWPLQRYLLRSADTLRRGGRWGDALSLVGSYLRLRLQRLQRPGR
ncbi:MAG: glycosyltransferase [Rubrivivax sp.]|nr:glycosyltransferase [Rubrivivax sp.]